MLGEHSILLTLLGESDTNRIIDFLIDRHETDVSIPDISEHTNIPRTTIYRIMEELQDDEIVEVSRKIGKINLFKINKGHERIRLLILAEQLIQKHMKG